MMANRESQMATKLLSSHPPLSSCFDFLAISTSSILGLHNVPVQYLSSRLRAPLERDRYGVKLLMFSAFPPAASLKTKRYYCDGEPSIRGPWLRIPR